MNKMFSYDIKSEEARRFVYIFLTDLTLFEYKDMKKAYKEAVKIKKEKGIYSHLDKDINSYLMPFAYIIVVCFLIFFKYKIKKFEKKYPEYLL